MSELNWSGFSPQSFGVQSWVALYEIFSAQSGTAASFFGFSPTNHHSTIALYTS
jgi:hypothetical protein